MLFFYVECVTLRSVIKPTRPTMIGNPKLFYFILFSGPIKYFGILLNGPRKIT